MNACDNKLMSSLVEAMKLDNASLEEELQHCEPHVFSPDFERRMEKLIKTQRSKGKIRNCFRYIAATVMVLFLTGGILVMGSEDLNASKVSVDIIEWLDECFVVRKGTSPRKETGILFDESCIGYLPEGFEKVEESVTYSQIHYKYENRLGDTITIHIYTGASTITVDNEDVIKEVLVNEAGYEYTRIYKDKLKSETLLWQDNEGKYYYLSGTLNKDEMLKIMNNISCRE